MNFKKIGIGIACAIMACSILAGCGGGDDPMTAMVKSGGQAVKYGDKEAKVLALETPAEIKNLDTYNGGIYWLKDAFYAVGYTDTGVMKFTIKDKKVVIPEKNVIVKNASKLDGTDGTRLYYIAKESPKLHSAILDDKDEGPILKEEDASWFTPAPGGKQGFFWNNSERINAVKMENGKITNVEKVNWLKNKDLSGPVGMIIAGESVFLKTSVKINGKDQRCIAELKMDGTLIRKYGDKNVKEPGGLDGLGGWTVTKDYVVIYDNMNGRFNVYKRADGSFVAAMDRDKAGMKESADAMTTITGNLILTYGYLDGTSHFYMILL